MNKYQGYLNFTRDMSFIIGSVIIGILVTDLLKGKLETIWLLMIALFLILFSGFKNPR